MLQFKTSYLFVCCLFRLNYLNYYLYYTVIGKDKIRIKQMINNIDRTKTKIIIMNNSGYKIYN